jgi:phage/plasmid-like protein (TIGR03299 family)
MSDEIDLTSGKPAFAFDAEEGGAWHGLGNPISEKDAKDPVAIAKIARADYTVSKRPISYDFNGVSRSVPNREALIRNDTGAVLEVLSENRYHEVQPIEYFESFRDSLAANNLRISSAGVLKGGQIVFVNAKLDGDFAMNIMGVDETVRYICMGGGYTGKMSSFGYLNDFRTVCWNTLSMAMSKHSDGGTLFRMAHSAPFNGKALGAAIGLAGKEVKIRAEVFNIMARRSMAMDAAKDFFAKVVGVKDDGKMSPQLLTKLNALADAYVNGPGANLVSAKGTVYGALNAVTHYVDHLAVTRDTTNDGEGRSRFASAQFGSGAAMKNKALVLAMAAAGIEEKILMAA